LAEAGGLKGIFNIKKEELPFSLLMGAYFFLVITSFWIVKPIKKSLFISYYKATEGFDLFGWHMLGSQAELLAKVLNMVVAAVAVTVFTWLSRRYIRQQLTIIFSVFSVVCFVLFSVLVKNPGGGTVWSLYLFGDLYSTLMVPTFFAYLNDSVTGDQAKRLYGRVGCGGVLGGAVGATTLAAFIKQVSNPTWMLIMAAVAVVIIIVAVAASRLIPSKERAAEAKPEVEKLGGNPAIEGARLALRSRYLLAIVAIVGLYEMVSTIMDFQFSSTVEHFVSGENIGAHFSKVFSITNISAMIVQLFLTSFIMTRFGVGVALLVLPVAAMIGSAGFLILPSLLTGSALNTADNAFSYSINQSSKEALYVPTTKEEKYKAKAFIDMFVQRFAKSVAVGLSLILTSFFTEFSTIRWLSLLVALILVVWIFAARYAGRKFEEMTRTPTAVAAD
jgi:ATP:ADP antiporter, AAA family